VLLFVQALKLGVQRRQSSGEYNVANEAGTSEEFVFCDSGIEEFFFRLAARKLVVCAAASGSVFRAVIGELDFRGSAARFVDRWIRLALSSRDLNCFPYRELFFVNCESYIAAYF